MTSTVAPVVVRQNDPSGPRYQDGIGYSFLQNSPKYPGLCRHADGTLVLTLSAALSGEMVTTEEGLRYVDEARRTEVMLSSTNNGMSWSQPWRIPGYGTTPMGDRRCAAARPPQPRRRALSSLVQRGWRADVVGVRTGATSARWPHCVHCGDEVLARGEPHSLPVLRRVPIGVACRHGSVLRSYDVDAHAWGDPSFFPAAFRSSEASLARATNGDMVASFRSARDGIPAPSDHWRSIVTAYSTDDGRTWSEPLGALALRKRRANPRVQ